MYLAHYKLDKKPFDISPNPEFLWLGEKHREGLATLKYGILENKGFLMITGEVGTGKTALIRAIENEIQAKIIVVTIPDPSLSLMDFYNVMAAELNMGRSFASKGEFLVGFKKLILQAASTHQRVLMIIDESQRLSSALLEEIRLLSNIDLGGKVLINTFFVGQRQHDDGDILQVRIALQAIEHLNPVHDRHGDIEDNEARLLLGCRGQAFGTVFRLANRAVV